MNLPNVRPEDARREKSATERASGVFTQWRQVLKRRPDVRIHVLELPGYLIGYGCGMIRSGQPGRGRTHGVRGPTGNEASANFTRNIKLSPSKRPGTSSGITRSAVRRSLRLE